VKASRRLIILAAVPCALLPLVLCVLVAACGSNDQGTATPTPQSAQGVQDKTGCQAASAPGAKDVGKLARPKTELSASKTYVATVATNCGDFEITLDSKRAPKTGGSFKYLADKGFFDNLTFHRVDSGFVIQGGDPNGDGTGGPGYSIVETPPADLAYTRGVVAMAKTQMEKAGTSGSQFFVVTGEDISPQLGSPPQYALLGTVTKGIETVEKIDALPVNGSTPVDPVVIRQIKVAEQP
jgi:peptidyl-prolyl cis-trans isomerase B (cyclophilin B)